MNRLRAEYGRLIYLYSSRLVEPPFLRQHIRLLEREVQGSSCRTVLDVGCGDGSHMVGLAPLLDELVGIDCFEPALRRAEARGIYTQTLLAGATEIARLFGRHSFDCVVAFDLIEHLTRPEGEKLLEAMERIATRKVIVFTPNGFLRQSERDGNPYQVHRSGWPVGEMRSRGYRVVGVHGVKPLLGEASVPRWHPRIFWKTLTVLTQPLCERIPELAFQILCAKDLKAAA